MYASSFPFLLAGQRAVLENYTFDVGMPPEFRLVLVDGKTSATDMQGAAVDVTQRMLPGR